MDPEHHKAQVTSSDNCIAAAEDNRLTRLRILNGAQDKQAGESPMNKTLVSSLIHNVPKAWFKYMDVIVATN